VQGAVGRLKNRVSCLLHFPRFTSIAWHQGIFESIALLPMSTARQSRLRFKFDYEDSRSESIPYNTNSAPSASEIKHQIQRCWERERQRLEDLVKSSRTSAYVKLGSEPKKKSHLRIKSSDDAARDIARQRRRVANAASMNHMQLVLPSTILQKGGSNPFNTYAIPVKAETNEILRFYEKKYFQ
jgi:hypothetical protein